jgi:hypothetical protein
VSWLIVILAIFVPILVLNALAARRGGKTGRDVVVRCSNGHLFTTTWIALVSFTAIRLGNARVQRCPVCERWTRVTRARDSELTDEDRHIAAAHHDVHIP